MSRSLLEVLRNVTLDPSEHAAFSADPAGYLAQYGYGDVAPEDLTEAFSLVADTLPVEVASQFTPSFELGGEPTGGPTMLPLPTDDFAPGPSLEIDPTEEAFGAVNGDFDGDFDTDAEAPADHGGDVDTGTDAGPEPEPTATVDAVDAVAITGEPDLGDPGVGFGEGSDPGGLGSEAASSVYDAAVADPGGPGGEVSPGYDGADGGFGSGMGDLADTGLSREAGSGYDHPDGDLGDEASQDHGDEADGGSYGDGAYGDPGDYGSDASDADAGDFGDPGDYGDPADSGIDDVGSF